MKSGHDRMEQLGFQIGSSFWSIVQNNATISEKVYIQERMRFGNKVSVWYLAILNNSKKFFMSGSWHQNLVTNNVRQYLSCHHLFCVISLPVQRLYVLQIAPTLPS